MAGTARLCAVVFPYAFLYAFPYERTGRGQA